jgi:acetylglutamate kinase
VPSWAGAIAIDLLPAVLVFILAVVHGAIRRQEETLPFAQRITAAELLEAMEVQRALGRQGMSIEEALQATENEDERANTDSNITSLDTAAKAPRKGPPA